MRRALTLSPILLLLAASLPAQGPGPATHDVADRLARWKPVEMPFRSQALSARERQLVEKLVEACQLLDSVYWRHSDLEGLALYKTTRDQPLHDLLGIMGGRWDLLDHNH